MREKMNLIKLCFMFLMCVPMFVICDNEEDADVVSVQTVEDGEEVAEEVFIPTKEWQTVKPGQKIPRGLHVRMDMQGGGKQAKLPDLDETGSEKKQMSLAEVEEALKNIASSDDAPDALKNVKREKSEFRSYDSLKKELKNADVDVKSDIQVIEDLSNKYHQTKTDEEKEVILEDLEYYVHQIDNAQHWVALGGVNAMVLPAINSTNEKIRSLAAFLLGSSMQNNPKVQVSAVDSGIIPELLRLLSFDPSYQVKLRALYAISAATRRFPFAQMKLVAHGGLTVFFKLLETSGSEDPLKLQLKVVTLLHDLVQEFQDAQLQQRIMDTEEQRERLKQYYHVGMEEKVKLGGFCKYFSKFLKNPTVDKKDRRQDLGAAVAETVPIRQEHDVLEKVINAMLTFEKSCQRAFTKSLGIVQELHKQYAELASHETDQETDKFFKDMELKCDKLSKKIASRIPPPVKEEL